MSEFYDFNPAVELTAQVIYNVAEEFDNNDLRFEDGKAHLFGANSFAEKADIYEGSVDYFMEAIEWYCRIVSNKAQKFGLNTEYELVIDLDDEAPESMSPDIEAKLLYPSGVAEVLTESFERLTSESFDDNIMRKTLAWSALACVVHEKLLYQEDQSRGSK